MKNYATIPAAVSTAPFGPKVEVFVFINGILNRPGAAFEWTDRAEDWINVHGGEAKVAKFEYFSPALLRRIWQRQHADELAEKLAQYPRDTHRLHLVGHSNGCDLIARAIRLTDRRIATVHLISGAVERDFGKNGLGDRLVRAQIDAVFCLCSRGDNAMKVARFTQLFSFLGLGYGDLGGRGPTNVPVAVSGRVREVWRDDMGHSDWFKPENFDRTMETVRTQALHP